MKLQLPSSNGWGPGVQEEADLWNADPFDVAAQARIAERINQQQIEHNFEQAWQHNPEARPAARCPPCGAHHTCGRGAGCATL